MTYLQGKTAIITGASSGIGRAAAFLFAKQGANIVANGRRGDALDAVVRQIEDSGSKAVAVVGDVSDEGVAGQLVETAQNRFGGLDIAFNNAGLVGPMAPIADIETEDWHTILDTNLTACFYGVRAQIPAMIERGGGSIILTSSFVGNSAAIPGMGAYAAAKAGVVGLAKSIAADYSTQAIRANALLPGGVETAMVSDETRAFAEGLHAMKRIADPEEIAQAALFLASDMASFVTGSAFYADGGNSAVKV